MYRNEIKIPKDRIAVLIGASGSIKKQIEEETGSKLIIDSEEGDVFIEGEDSIGIMIARNIVHAIARGFNPEIANFLIKPDYTFEIISMADYAGKSKNIMERLKGRVIGMRGKARANLENLTETHISVYGKTIAIIGEISRAALAKKAVEGLLEGSSHATIYKKLEKRRRELAMEDVLRTVKNER